MRANPTQAKSTATTVLTRRAGGAPRMNILSSKGKSPFLMWTDNQEAGAHAPLQHSCPPSGRGGYIRRAGPLQRSRLAARPRAASVKRNGIASAPPPLLVVAGRFG